MKAKAWLILCALLITIPIVTLLLTWRAESEVADIIVCRSKYDIAKGNSYFNSTINVTTFANKGVALITGDYYKQGASAIPMKVNVSFTIKRKGNTYEITNSSTLVNPKTLSEDSTLINMLNIFVFKEHSRLYLRVNQRSNGDYVFFSGAVPVLLCAKER